jgi:hypothetical protein
MDLVQINRAINKKATDLDWRMTLSGDVLITSGWTHADPPKIGAGSWLDLGSSGAGTPGIASFIGPDPRVTDAVATINLYLRMALQSRRIPENAIMAVQSGESGIKVVADSAALTGFRKQRANTFRPWERELIRLALFTKAIHSGMRVRYEQVPAPSVAYTMPQQPMSAERQAEWDRSHRLNITTAVDELMEREPSLTHEEAEERIAKNAEYNRRGQATPVFDRKPQTDDKGADDGE